MSGIQEGSQSETVQLKTPEVKPQKQKQQSKSKKNKKGNASGKLMVLEQHKRVNLLHQAGIYLAMQGTSANDGFAKLSRRYAASIREVGNTEVLKIEPDIWRSFCQKCKQFFVSNGIRKFKLTVVNNDLDRECLHCGKVNRYQINKKYKSRNEKFRENSDHTDFALNIQL